MQNSDFTIHSQKEQQNIFVYVLLLPTLNAPKGLQFQVLRIFANTIEEHNSKNEQKTHSREKTKTERKDTWLWKRMRDNRPVLDFAFEGKK